MFRSLFFLFFVYFFLSLTSLSFSQYKVAGTISDQKSGAPLFGATVYDSISKNGASTNEYGHFVFYTDSGSVALKVSYVGYGVEEYEGRSAYSTKLNFQLSPSVNLSTLEVFAKKDPGSSANVNKMDKKFITSLPQFLGENDVIKAAQFTPGVQPSGELSNGLAVRGGSPDQNLIMLDGIPIYNVSHLLGLFSSIGPDAIQSNSVLKGSFPAKYGGRLSSVLDIRTKPGNNQKFTGNYGLGPILSNIHLEGPLGKNKRSTLLISGRRSFLDLIARPIILIASDGEASGGFHFHDLIVRYDYKLSERDQLHLTGYWSKDKLSGRSFNKKVQERIGAKLGFGNELLGAQWTRTYTSGVFMRISASYSNYSYLMGGGYEDLEDSKNNFAAEYRSGIRDFRLRGDWETANTLGQFNYGGQIIQHQFTPGITNFENLENADEIISQNFNLKLNNLESFAFAEWQRSWTDKVSTSLGVNINSLLVDDTNYISLDPRIKINYQLNRLHAISLGASKMTQTVHLLSNPALSLPTDLWITSSDELAPSKSYELNLSYQGSVKSWQFTGAIYYKWLNNIIEAQEGKQLLSLGNDWEQNLSQGTGRAYGAEMFVQRNFNKLETTLGLTYARSLRTVIGVNNNEEFPYKYDRPLYLTQTGNWNFKPNKSFSWSFTLASGYRYTLPIGSFNSRDFIAHSNHRAFNAYQVYLSDNRNDRQFPIYHRLDLAYESKKSKKRGERIWRLGLTNAYNRANPSVVYPNTSDTQDPNNPTVKGISILPIIPTFKWTRTF